MEPGQTNSTAAPPSDGRNRSNTPYVVGWSVVTILFVALFLWYVVAR
jgi:hypothetical protein